MAKKQVIVTHPYFNDDTSFEYNQTTYPDDHDAQLHGTGALVILQMVPDIKAADGSTRADLVAIFNKGDWIKVEVK